MPKTLESAGKPTFGLSAQNNLKKQQKRNARNAQNARNRRRYGIYSDADSRKRARKIDYGKQNAAQNCIYYQLSRNADGCVKKANQYKQQNKSQNESGNKFQGSVFHIFSLPMSVFLFIYIQKKLCYAGIFVTKSDTLKAERSVKTHGKSYKYC